MNNIILWLQGIINDINIDKIILWLLGVITIRQLIAQNFDIPLPPKIRWLVYDKKVEAPVLCRRAYDTAQLFKNNSTEYSITEELLELAGRHIKYYKDGLFHNRPGGSDVNSKYFINTLEASYNDRDLEIMTCAIRKLISNSGLKSKVDFVLFIKSGNQILAREIYQGDQQVIYICKLDSGSNIRPIRPEKEAHEFSIQYENLEALLCAEKNSAYGNLNGIAIDCSVSSGYGLKESIKQFNKMIEDHALKINPIKDAFVLYCHRPNPLPDAGFTLHRFFDMNEEIRTLIYQYANQMNKNWPKEVYKKLKEKKLLRVQ